MSSSAWLHQSHGSGIDFCVPPNLISVAPARALAVARFQQMFLILYLTFEDIGRWQCLRVHHITSEKALHSKLHFNTCSVTISCHLIKGARSVVLVMLFQVYIKMTRHHSRSVGVGSTHRHTHIRIRKQWVKKIAYIRNKGTKTAHPSQTIIYHVLW